MRRLDHPNNPDYDWGPADPIDNPIPADIVKYHRQFKPGYWGYVCPCCRNVWAPGWGGMPDSFRGHIREYLQGRGCFFNPKAIAAPRTTKHADKAASF